MLVFGT